MHITKKKNIKFNFVFIKNYTKKRNSCANIYKFRIILKLVVPQNLLQNWVVALYVLVLAAVLEIWPQICK